jgi:sterol desaturase/sphingolipid hydroxylase (fatty acid hydroxylase superfamily)
MDGLITASIPAFLFLLVVDWLVHRFAPDQDQRGYAAKDTVTSLAMGLGNQLFGLIKLFSTGGLIIAAAALTPLSLSAADPWTWVLALVLGDLSYYWSHRAQHRIRLLWAHHNVHHSSEYFNLSTALRQGWLPPIVAVLAVLEIPAALLGVPPWVIFMAHSINLLYQFPLHTERVDKLWAPIEFLFVTPSHHRVHHGVNNPYLDKNYGGILIIWDRIFGTYAPELERVTFGLTTNVNSHNPLRVGFHELAGISRDVGTAQTWRDRLGYVFGPPGWRPKD